MIPYRNLEGLETELLHISDQSYVTPYIPLMKVKKALAQYNFSFDDMDAFIKLAPGDSFFFQLNYPTLDPSDPGEPLYLTVEVDFDPEKGYSLALNVLGEEELDEFIGDDEIEDI